MISPKLMLFLNIILAVVFLVAGWFGYDWVLHQVTADLSQSVVAVSPDEVLNQRLLVSLTFALVGVASGIGVWLISRVSNRRRDVGYLLLLISVAIVAIMVVIRLQAHSISSLSKYLEGSTGTLKASISLSSIHLYQIGLIASASVLTVSFVLSLFTRLSKRKM